MANIAKTAVELDAKTGQYQAKMSAAAKHTNSVFGSMQNSISGIGQLQIFAGAVSGLSAVGSAMSALASNAVSLGASLANMAIEQARSIDALNDLSDRTGLSVESLSRLGYVAKLSGTDIESVTGAYKKFSVTMGKAGFQGNLEQAFAQTLQYLGSIPDQAQRAAAGAEYFGKSWSELGGMINLSSSDWQTMISDADRFGYTISGPLAESVGMMFDKFDALTMRVAGFGNMLMGAVSPYVISAFDTLSKSLDDLGLNSAGFSAAFAKIPEYLNAAVAAGAEWLPVIEKTLSYMMSLAGVVGTAVAPFIDLLKMTGGSIGNMAGAVGALSAGDFQGAGREMMRGGDLGDIFSGRGWSATRAAGGAYMAATPLMNKMDNGTYSKAMIDILSQIKDNTSKPAAALG